MKHTAMYILLALLLAAGVSGINFVACGQNINVVGGTYTMSGDLNYSGAGPCVEIDTVNVTFDCDTHTIQHVNSFATSNAIQVSTGISGVTVKNCQFEPNNTDGSFFPLNVYGNTNVLLIGGMYFTRGDYPGGYYVRIGELGIDRPKTGLRFVNNVINATAIYLSRGADTNFEFTGNYFYGGLLVEDALHVWGGTNNTFYDNDILTTAVTVPNSAGLNYNVTKHSDTNIMNGVFTAGNHWWANDGTAFSDTCDDVDGDNVCDFPYVNGYTDYAPITNLTIDELCDLADGCLFWDQFNQADQVAVEPDGWYGDSLGQIYNGEYVCVAPASVNIIHRFDTFITEAMDNIYVNVTIAIGNDTPNSGFILRLLDSEVSGTYNMLRLQIDDQGRFYNDGPNGWELLGTSAWTNSIYLADEKVVQLVIGMDTKRYNIYVDGSLLRANVQMTEDSPSLHRITDIVIGGFNVPYWCHFRVDEIKITSNLDLDAVAAAAAAYVGSTGLYADGSGFDESTCEAGQDVNFCFMQQVVAGIFGGVWSFIINNILVTLAIILCVIIWAFLKRAGGK